MKNYSLSMQIWLVFATLTLGVTILLSILLPWILRDFFTNEIYATIESAQNVVLKQDEQPANRGSLDTDIFQKRRRQVQDARTVNHFLITEDARIITHSPQLPKEFFQQVSTEIQEQTAKSQQYEEKIEDRKIFYVARRVEVAGENNVYLASYMWDNYRDDLVQTLFQRISLIMGGVLLFSWIPSLLLAKHLSRPLVSLEKRVKKLTNREWTEPVEQHREDEIGKLGQSIEQLRKQLIHHDEAQQNFLQHISHELKTPIMVIRSYIQSIRDGIYPKGDLSDTAHVIDEEAEQLEKRVQNLLYLTKLDYMETHELTYETFDLSQLVREVADRLSLVRQELQWSLKLSPVKITGDKDQWKIVLENLLDNQVRFSNNEIAISLSEFKDDTGQTNDTFGLLHIWNDGPQVEKEQLSTIFDKFNKGHKGKFGLGLAVAKRIVDMHNANIWVENKEEGVSFFIKIDSGVKSS